MIQFSNPRLSADFENWPLGGNRRGLCTFNVEYKPNKGWRFSRKTTGKPKTATYGGKAAIVDGDDGKTYLIQFAGQYDFIQIRKSDFMSASGCIGNAKDPQKCAAFPGDEVFLDLQRLILIANSFSCT